MLAAQEWEEFDPFGWDLWGENTGSTLRVRDAETGLGVVFSGSVNDKSAGYVIESENLGLRGKQRLKLVISGIENTDRFDQSKLLKLELNGRAQRTQNGAGMNRNDPDFINARNGEYIFDLTRPENILKINWVFFPNLR